MLRSFPRVLLLFLAIVSLPAPAAAQWYVSFYLGANHTSSSDISVTLPGQDASWTFHDVAFEGKPFESPQYYGYRAGKFFGAKRRFGIEGELIHLKVIAKTAADYQVTGSEQGTPISETARMDARVQRYQMTHGLNFLLVNVVARRPIGAGENIWLTGRAGLGPTVPHGETNIANAVREKYEYAGIGMHVSGGVAIALNQRFAITGEYKLTRARPEIDVAGGGTGRTTAVSHQIAGGLAIALTR